MAFQIFVGNVTILKVHHFIFGEHIRKRENIGIPNSILIHMILKVNLQLKPEVFLLGLMDKQIERFYGTLCLYMITVARLLYAQGFTNTYTGRIYG